jgi:protein-S-isoprenylcysteine O-methyltransferase Ste14
MPVGNLFYAIWFAWAVSWMAAAAWTARTQKRPGSGAEIPYRVVTVIGAVLLMAVGPLRRLPQMTLWHAPHPVLAVLAAVTAASFVFCWWARLHLGRLWSGAITRKDDHRVIDTGPYHFVRHPIYTGIIGASFATAAAEGTLTAVIGAALMTLGWYMKARLEERFLREELGAQAYDAYARKTAMLVPFLRV